MAGAKVFKVRENGEKNGKVIGKKLVAPYKPQARQELLHSCYADEILYGGARGGGKSWALRWDGIIWCLKVGNLNAYLFRKTYPDLEKNHIVHAERELKEWEDAGFIKWDYVSKRLEFVFNGSALNFCHLQNDRDLKKYQGQEINLLLIDEITHFTKKQYTTLTGSVRNIPPGCPEELRHFLPRIVCSGNPGDVGHAWVKKKWIDGLRPLTIYAGDDVPEITRCFIPSKLSDNPKLEKADPLYRKRLEQQPEEIRRAWLDGDWDVYEGQVFGELKRSIHGIEPFEIPKWWKRVMAIDWGYAKPYAIYWGAVDGDGNLYIYRELYGWSGVDDEGVKEDAGTVARKVAQIEKASREAVFERYADPSMFIVFGVSSMGAKGSGISIADNFSAENIHLTPADNDRINGKMQVHYRLQVVAETGKPRIYIFNNCHNFWRTVPSLCYDENKVEDVNTKQEDHAYDAIRYMCMAYQLGSVEQAKPKTLEQRIEEYVNKPSPEYTEQEIDAYLYDDEPEQDDWFGFGGYIQ